MRITKMQKRVMITLVICTLCKFASAQCPTVSIGLPDSICAGEQFFITNSGASNQQYSWDFCGGEILDPPQISPLYTGVAGAGGPEIIYDNGNYYVFVINSGTLSRFDFGNSLSNTPTHNNLNTFGGLLVQGSDINIVKENGNWYGLVCRWNNFIIRLDFGSSITNLTPTGTPLTIPGAQLGFPFYQTLEKDSGNYYLITANLTGAKISVINFGNTITTAAPSVSTVAIPTGVLVGVAAAKDCGNWYAYTTHANSAALTKINFGSSLSNVPTVTSVTPTGNPSGSRQFEIVRENGDWIGLAVENSGAPKLKRFHFGTSLDSIPKYSPSPGTAGVNGDRGLGVSKFGSSYYAAITNTTTGNTKILSFADSCIATPVSIDSIVPGPVTYQTGGWQYVSLNIIDSLGNENQILDSLYVIPAPTPAYSINRSCVGVPVLFSDSSIVEGSTITDWLWNFGDGTTSDLQNPTHTYNTSGSYPLSLTTTSAEGCISTLFDTLAVNVPPTADFVFQDSTCGNAEITFVDSTSSSTGNIVQWGWFLGDSTVSAMQNPMHIYDSSGVFTVQLYAIDDGGCEHDTSKQVTILAAPKSDYSFDNTCINRATVFTNLTDSNLSAVSSYLWIFGDGNTSNSTNGFNTYAGPSSNYNASLVAISSNACTDTVTKVITVSDAAVPDFTTSMDSACTSNPIIFESISFAQAGDSIINYHWDFGDGTTANVDSVMHSFLNPGSYNVTLTVRTETSCDSSISKNIFVSPSPIADFTFTEICEGTPTTFNDLSIPQGSISINSWQWQFGDTIGDSIQNPVHTYPAASTYTVTLMIVDDLGCFDTVVKPVNVYANPVADFTFSNACTDTLTQFTDLSFVNNGTISSWYWEFGDGSTSDWKNPKYEYPSSGIYPVELIVETVEGCADTIMEPIEVFDAPEGNFNASTTCEGDLMSFTFVTIITPSPVSAWFWQFGDGGVSTIENPAHLYLTAGNYPVQLSFQDTATGCFTNVSQMVIVNAIPVADFSYSGVCEKSPVQFSDSSAVAGGVISDWLWNFGDGSTSTLQNPVHVYDSAGIYNVKLIIMSPEGCQDSITKQVQIFANPVANFSINPTFGSAPLLVNFTNNSVGASSYFWSFGDGSTSSASNPMHTYDSLGQYNPVLIATSTEGCVDTTDGTLTVLIPMIDLAILDIDKTVNGNAHTISAEIINLGNVEINNFEIKAQLQNNGHLFEIWNGSLLSGQTIQYEFGSALFAQNNSEFFCVEINLLPEGSDINPSNDKICKSFSSDFDVIQVYPNPFPDNFHILIQSPNNAEIKIDIYDASGKQLIDTKVINVMAGLNDETIRAQNLSSGQYLLIVRKGDEERDILIFKD